MNKKDKKSKVVFDDKEDLEIKKVAYFKSSSQILLFVILILLFGLTFFSSLVYIGKYYLNSNKDAEIIEIEDYKNNIFITNDGKINRSVTKKDIENKENIVIEKYATIELKTNKNSNEDGKVLFNVRYDINENDFSINPISTNASDVLVRFAYSFDNEDWTYINNVISANDSNLSPLMGNYFDIAGLISNLKIITNYELTNKPNEMIKMYWKSETVIQSKSENINKNLNVNFKIEYKENS